MKIDFDKYKNIEIDKDKFKDLPTNEEQLRNCLAICYVLMEDKDKEIERLHSIIKEVREYIVSQKLHKIVDTTGGLTYEERKLLEILDKVEENK